MLREGITAKGYCHDRFCPLEHHSHELAGNPKGIKRVLRKRGLWPEPRASVLKGPTHNIPDCDSGEGLLCSPSA